MPMVADFVLLRILPVYYIRVMDNVLSLMVPLRITRGNFVQIYF